MQNLYAAVVNLHILLCSYIQRRRNLSILHILVYNFFIAVFIRLCYNYVICNKSL